MPGPLYDYLAEMIQQQHEDTNEDEAREQKEFERHIDYLLGQLEGFSDAEAARHTALLREHGGPIVDGMFADAFLREMFRRIPELVARARQISPLVPHGIPSDATQVYLREATRCYLFGFWCASVALSRAALEEALRTVAEEKVKHKPDSLRELLKACIWLGLLDKPIADMADKVVLAGNRVLHAQPTNREEAWDVLCAARGVLLDLFSRDCGG